MNLKNLQTGQTLVELMIVIALLGILLPAIIMGLIASRDGKPQQEKRMKAAQLMKESGEAIRIIREAGWSNIESNGTFHPINSGSTWTLASGSETIDGISRQIVISDVYRDSIDNRIVESGGVLDPSTKKIELMASWTIPLPSSLDSTFYLARFLDNAVYEQTTEADFNTGIHTGTNVVNNEGGEVVLGAGGGGNWCSPTLDIAGLDLPGSALAQAVTAIEGRAFAGTGENSSGVSFHNIAISNTNPPVAVILGTMDGYKTNDIFGEANYGYIATDTNSKEIVIISIETNPYSAVGYYDAPGSTNADSVFVSGNVGFITQGQNFRSFDLSSKNGSRPQLGSVDLDHTGKSIVVNANYAYIAVAGDTSKKLQIVDVSNPSSMTKQGTANPDSASGQDIAINDTATRAYLTTNKSATQRELFVIDITNKTGNLPILGSYDTGDMDPKGVEVVPGNLVIVVGTGGEEYQVVNITNESNPIRCGGMDVPSGIYDSASVLESDNDAFTYIVTGDSGQEFQIIAGGPGGSYSNEGVYESATFEIGYSTAFNRILPNYHTPFNTTVQFQTAVADPIADSCNGATFVFTGPDGTDTTYYTGEDNIRLDNDGTGYENPGRCFRYRAYLSSADSSATPIFKDISINYSP